MPRSGRTGWRGGTIAGRVGVGCIGGSAVGEGRNVGSGAGVERAGCSRMNGAGVGVGVGGSGVAIGRGRAGACGGWVATGRGARATWTAVGVAATAPVVAAPGRSSDAATNAAASTTPSPPLRRVSRASRAGAQGAPAGRVGIVPYGNGPDARLLGREPAEPRRPRHDRAW